LRDLVQPNNEYYPIKKRVTVVVIISLHSGIRNQFLQNPLAANGFRRCRKIPHSIKSNQETFLLTSPTFYAIFLKSISPTCLCTAFTHAEISIAQKTLKSSDQCLLALLGSAQAKATGKRLVKLTPVVRLRFSLPKVFPSFAAILFIF